LIYSTESRGIWYCGIYLHWAFPCSSFNAIAICDEIDGLVAVKLKYSYCCHLVFFANQDMGV